MFSLMSRLIGGFVGRMDWLGGACSWGGIRGGVGRAYGVYLDNDAWEQGIMFGALLHSM